MNNWIIPYIKQYQGRSFLAVLFGFLGVASAGMLLFVSGYLISKSALRPENIMLVYVPIVSVRAFSISQALFPYLNKLVSHDIVLRILAQYRRRLYDMIEPQAIFLQARYQTGDVLGVLADDIEKLQDIYIRSILPAIIGVTIYLVLAIVIGFYDLMFMLLYMSVLGVIVFFMPLFAYFIMRKNYTKIKGSRSKLYQSITDAMYGQLDWLISGRKQEVMAQVKQTNENLIQTEKKIARWHHMRDALLQVIVGLAIIGMMIWINKQVDDGSMSPTIIAAFVLMMFAVTEALLPMSEAVEEIPTYFDAMKRMDQFEGFEIEQIQDSPNVDLSRPTLNIQRVSYTYPGSHEKSIDDVSLSVAAGKKIALLGKSGTGKSTLLKLIAGVLQPTGGKVMLDGIEMHASYLSTHVSVLNQKAHLFHTTIANNIRIGKADATEEEIIAVLEKAQIMDYIRTLPAGIHTSMEEMGQRFSGGEKQRIAFARVLIQNTPIILLDEPTTGLDPQTERALLETFLAAAPEKTIIWITHHLLGAELLDEVIFLEDGKIKMQGSHERLYQTNKHYQRLYALDEA